MSLAYKVLGMMTSHIEEMALMDRSKSEKERTKRSSHDVDCFLRSDNGKREQY